MKVRNADSEYTLFAFLMDHFTHSNFVLKIWNDKNRMELLPGRQIGNQGGLKDEFLPEHSSIDRTGKRYKNYEKLKLLLVIVFILFDSEFNYLLVRENDY